MSKQILRKCYQCKCLKPLKDFNKCKNKYLGVSNECRECNRIRMKEYRKSDKFKQSNSQVNRKLYSIQYSKTHKEYEMWRTSKSRAKRDNREFNIEVSDIIIPDICPVLGLFISKEAKGRQDNSPSLDRIDNSKGYVKGNICVISWKANNIKNVGTAEEHRKIAEYIDKFVK